MQFHGRESLSSGADAESTTYIWFSRSPSRISDSPAASSSDRQPRGHHADGPEVTQRRGGDIRLIAFITEPGPIRKILTHLGEALEPPSLSPARVPPKNWGELVQAHEDRDVFQATPEDLPAIDIHSL